MGRAARAASLRAGRLGSRRREHQLADLAGDPGLAGPRRNGLRIGDQIPHPPAAKRQHEESLHEDQGAERVAAGRDIRLDGFRKARIRDIGAEQINIEHAPGIEQQRRLPQRREARVQCRIAPPQPRENDHHEAHPHKRDDKGQPGHQHAEPGKRSPIFGQPQRAADQQILPGAPLQTDQEDRIGIGQQEQDQRGRSQRQGDLDWERRITRQIAAAANASEALSGQHRARGAVQLTAVAASQ